MGPIHGVNDHELRETATAGFQCQALVVSSTLAGGGSARPSPSTSAINTARTVSLGVGAICQRRSNLERAAADGRQGLSQEGDRAAGQMPTRRRQQHRRARPVLLDGGRRSRLRPLPMLTGSGPKAAKWAPFTWINTALGNIKTALAGTYHHRQRQACPALSRQLRLALVWGFGCQALNVGIVFLPVSSSSRWRQPSRGLAHDVPRGARPLARIIAPQACIRSDPWGSGP